MFKDFFRKFYSKLRNVPFLKHAIALNEVKEITDGIVVAQNSATPPHLKTLAITKSSCCTVSLISAYAAQKISEPKIANVFYVCCVASSLGYKYSGGNNITALSLISLANKTDLTQQI